MRRSRTRVAPDPARPFLLRYGMSFAITLWVLVILLPLGSLPEQQPFGILLGAVALSAWYGGMGPGLISAIAGAIFAIYMAPPAGVFTMAMGTDHFLQIGSYLIAALSIGALADRRDTAESLARAAEDEREAVLSCVEDCVCAVASDGEIIYSSEATERIRGPFEALLGFLPDITYEVLDEQRVALPQPERPVQQVFAGHGDAEAVVCTRERATDAERWFIIRAKAMAGTSHNERIAVCVIYDITAIKHTEAERASLLEAEQEARRSAEHSASRLASLNHVSTVLSQALTPDQVTEAVLREGLSALGAHLGMLLMVTEDRSALRLVRQLGAPDAVVRRCASMCLDTLTPITESFQTHDIQWLESRDELQARYPGVDWAVDGDRARVAVPLCLDGRCLGILYIVLDGPRACAVGDRTFLWALSQQCAQALERSRLYEVERKARAEAEHSARALDEFLAMLSHELRNPLNSVVSATALLQHLGARDPELTEPLDVLHMETRQITRLVNDLLDISRITRGKIVLRRIPADLVQVVTRAVHCVQPQMEERRQELHIRNPRSGEALVALLDPARIEQVIGNLLNNASKYSDDGAPVVLSLERDGEDAVLRVRDEGIGIAPEFLPHVFEMFRQADRSLDRSGGGLGIGLTMVQRLVTMHGGSVEAVSDGVGTGCEFVVRLPLMTPVETVSSALEPAQAS